MTREKRKRKGKSGGNLYDKTRKLKERMEHHFKKLSVKEAKKMAGAGITPFIHAPERGGNIPSKNKRIHTPDLHNGEFTYNRQQSPAELREGLRQ